MTGPEGNLTVPVAPRSTPPWKGLCLPERPRHGEVECREGRTAIRATITDDTNNRRANDLTVTAFTPFGKTIVEYRLATIPEGAVAQRIAEIMLSQESVTAKLQAIAETITAEAPRPIACLQPPSELKHNDVLTREIPPFEQYARDPESIDSCFAGEIAQQGRIIKVRVTIEPDIRAATIRTASIHPGTGRELEAYDFRARCNEDFWTAPHTRVEITSQLLTTAWSVFDDIAAVGPAEAARIWTKPAIDERLKDGVITPHLIQRTFVLASGARVTQGVGDRLACLAIEANRPQGHTSRFTWVVSSDGNLLEQNSTLGNILNKAADAFHHGSTEARLKAIRALDEVSTKRAEAAPLESLLGFTLKHHLATFPSIQIRAAEPRGVADILALLDGVCPIDITFKDPGPNRQRPQDPNRLRIGIEPSGGLRLELHTSLGNYLAGIVPAERFANEHLRAELIKQAIGLFHQRRDRDTFRLRTLIETLAVPTTAPGNGTREIPTSPLQLPSTSSDIENLAYDTAAEVAKLYEVAGPPVSITEARVLFGSPTSCEISLASLNKRLPTTMKLHVVPSGVRAIELTTRGGSGPEGIVIPLSPPLAPGTDAQHLRMIFQYFKGLSGAEVVATPETKPNLRDTQLFRYVHRLRPAESLFDRVRVFLVRNRGFQGLFS